MNTRFKYAICAACFLIPAAVVLFQGCASQVPPVSAMVLPKAPPLPSNYISNFENDSIYVNPDLLGYPTGSIPVTQVAPNGSPSGSAAFNPGYWSDATYGGPAAAPNVINTPFVLPNAVSDGTDSSIYAIHIGLAAGPITCIAVGGYEADQLTCTLENNPSNPYYDATPFLNGGNGGIAFYYNIGADDTSTYRQFQVETINTGAPNYNHFHYLLPNGPSGGWQSVTVTWNQLVYPGFGPTSGAITTTGPTGNMNHFVFLQWQWSDNAQGSAGAPVTNLSDFWIDNVQFIP